MTRPPASGPNDTSKRRQLDMTALATAKADQQRRDAESPPPDLGSTMSAIRLFEDLIADRKNRGWTDAKLVALLATIGVDISAETLRVYRSRLAREKGGDASYPVPPSTGGRAGANVVTTDVTSASMPMTTPPADDRLSPAPLSRHAEVGLAKASPISPRPRPVTPPFNPPDDLDESM